MRVVALIALVVACCVGGCGGDSTRGDRTTSQTRSRTPPAPVPQAVAWTWPARELEQLTGAAGLSRLMHGRPVARTEWDDYVTVVLLEYLDERRGIDLLRSRFDPIAKRIGDEQDATTVVLSYDQRQRYARRLARLRPSRKELRRYYEGFTEEQAPNIGEGMQRALEVVRAGLRRTTPEQVVVVPLLP